MRVVNGVPVLKYKWAGFVLNFCFERNKDKGEVPGLKAYHSSAHTEGGMIDISLSEFCSQ